MGIGEAAPNYSIQLAALRASKLRLHRQERSSELAAHWVFGPREQDFVHLWRTLKAQRLEAAVFWLPPLSAGERREVLAERARAAILAAIPSLYLDLKATRPSLRSRSPTGEAAQDLPAKQAPPAL
jgi:hypothetical protein